MAHLTAAEVPLLQSSLFAREEFASRRARLRAAMPAGAIAVIQGAPPPRGFRRFRQDNDFQYLCGFRSPGMVLTLAAEGECTLYLPEAEAAYAPDGEVATVEHADAVAAAAGVERVRPLAELGSDLDGAEQLLLPFAPPEGPQGSRDELLRRRAALARDPWDGGEDRQERFRARLAAACPHATLADLTPLLDALRLVKSPAEVAVMRRAGALTARAVHLAMRATRPGVREYELQALALHVFMAGGAEGEGYRTILPSGRERIWNAHYMRNDGTLAAGEMVLMDGAPDLENYTSDIGRMWPVSGTFTAEQRSLYGYMVAYHRTLLGLLRPGVSAQQVTQEAAEAMAPVHATWTFPSEAHREAAARCLTFRGHLSHPVGMAVHDVGNYWEGVLQPGHVFAVDPQMWVREERLYYRVEDTVAITETGVEVLTAAAPAHPDEIEEAMRHPVQPLPA